MKPLTPFVLILSIGISLSLDQGAAQAQHADMVRYGEAAVTFANGVIQKVTPRDGIVNLITGDNQSSGNRMLMARRDTFYLKLDHPAEVAAGDLFTVYKRARKVFHPLTQEYLGFIVLRLAVVRVIETDGALATVEAVTSYGQVAPGDPVMRFIAPPAPDAATSLTSDVADLSGMIVELQTDKPMTLVSQFDIVYVDRGSADGLKTGDLMDIRRHSVGIPARKIGQLKVISTEEHTATARVIKANTRVLKGDRFKLVGYSAPVVQPVELVPTPAKAEKQDRTGGQPDTASADLVAGKLKTQDASGQSRINLGDVASFLRYESGEAAIKPESYTVLDQVIDHLLTSGDTRLIRVEGHTDNVEIGPSLKSRYPSNVDLANARAGGVLRYLVEKGGLDSARLTAVGYGDSKPAATNASEEGRTKNRRVEILLYEPTTDPQASTADVHNQAQKQGRDSSGLSARGTNGQLSTPQAVPLNSGAGTLSVGQQQQASAGDGTTLPSSPNTGGVMSSTGQQQPQAGAGDGTASSNNPNTSGAPSPNPNQQDPQQPAAPANF
ncbi:MAG: OmpA family protein [Nitrospira sp.]|nr:OmpA family protein [Nitrospira sp.]MBH0182307.1 OmpA family protein [Nitrospira sp.]MBH0184644.1 OmpA family protein [Nitrospira sp.]